MHQLGLGQLGKTHATLVAEIIAGAVHALADIEGDFIQGNRLVEVQDQGFVGGGGLCAGGGAAARQGQIFRDAVQGAEVDRFAGAQLALGITYFYDQLVVAHEQLRGAAAPCGLAVQRHGLAVAAVELQADGVVGGQAHGLCHHVELRRLIAVGELAAVDR